MNEGGSEMQSGANLESSEEIRAMIEREMQDLVGELGRLGNDVEELKSEISKDEAELADFLKDEIDESGEGLKRYLESLAEGIADLKTLLVQVETSVANTRNLLETLERQKTKIETLIVLEQNPPRDGERN